MPTTPPNHDAADTIVEEVTLGLPAQRPQPRPRRHANATLFFISLAANILLLLSLLAVVVLGRNGLLAPGKHTVNDNVASANAITSARSASATAVSKTPSGTPAIAN